ncbi:aryl-sulfate sulfotransferase [Chloroflexota bacterium]
MANIAATAIRGVTFHNPAKTSLGYTLLTPMGFSTWGTCESDVFLIDMEGYIVNRWRMPADPTNHGILLPNGHLMWCGDLGYSVRDKWIVGLPPGWAGVGNTIEERDWDGNLVRRVMTPGQSHDFLPLPDGHIMYPTYGLSQGILPDKLSARWKGGIPGSELDGKIHGDTICEVDQNDKIVWEWIAYEHLDPEIDAFGPLDVRTHFHTNSLWLCKDGGIIVSMRSLSSVVKIEYPSGKVVARHGKGKVFHQHDARELDDGNILIFDNGSHRNIEEPTYSRSVEIDPDTDEEIWEYKAEFPSDFYSPLMGGSERLPNGNTVICNSSDAASGRVFEVTHEGDLVWEYNSPFLVKKLDEKTPGNRNALFRAHRYNSGGSELKGKDLDPARFPWENRFFGPAAFKRDFSPCIF